VGQLTDPYSQGEDDEAVFTLSGLPDEPIEPPPPSGTAGDEHEHEGEDDAEDEHDGHEEHEELVFELDDWSEIERDAVTDRLREAGIPHWWVETSLHVADTDQGAVEAVLDAVEGDTNPLDPEQDQVAYDMSEWDEDRLTALADQLDAAEIDYGWDGDELFVYAGDEQAVDELIDKAAHPDELPPEPDDGEPGGELLGELFVVADRLQHDAEDHEASVQLLDLARVAETSEPPYGLDAKDWDHLRERVTALADVLREDKLDADAALTAAGDLRIALRPYV
jgi:hypothetical protein